MAKIKNEWTLEETGFRNCEIQYNSKKGLYWVKTNSLPHLSMGMFTDFFKALERMSKYELTGL